MFSNIAQRLDSWVRIFYKISSKGKYYPYMKIFTVLLFVLFTLLNVSRPANVLCDESIIVSHVKVCGLKSTASKNDSDSIPVQNENHQAHSSNHSCHLGHCAFILDAALSVNSCHLNASFLPSKYQFELLDFKPNPFRPPILFS